MAETLRSLSHADYTVGWICALPLELGAATAMLDEKHSALPVQPNDENTYILGRIGAHNIVIACLPYGMTGNNSAATVANDMARSFKSIKIRLMVGIGGGAPGEEADIRLGDVVVSKPTGIHGGVVQYDFGKTKQEGRFVRTGTLNKPPVELLGAIGWLEAEHMSRDPKFSEYISAATAQYPKLASTFAYPGEEFDELFNATYDHKTSETTCDNCDRRELVLRRARRNTIPRIHYGNIASGNEVMRHGRTRDRWAREENVICFEMEAAGLMDRFPCLVIRGICDYADSHKNKRWQNYAAATAAAYAKELLYTIPPGDGQVISLPAKSNNVHWLIPRNVNTFFTGRREILNRLQHDLCPSRPHREVKQRRFVLVGMGGSGKSEVCLKFAEENRERFWGIFWIDVSSEENALSSFVEITRLCNITDQSLDGAKRWLANTRHPWLLILDNGDRPELDYSKYFPSGNRGVILITTRLRDCLIHQTVGYVEFEKLDFDDAAELLLKSSGIGRDVLNINRDSALRVVTILGQHALAITQAGAYIRNKNCTLDEYLDMFQGQRKRLLEYRPLQAKSTYGDVYATFEVSATMLEASPLPEATYALSLLQVLAFFHFEGVPESVFTRAWEYATILSRVRKEPELSIRHLSDWHVTRSQIFPPVGQDSSTRPHVSWRSKTRKLTSSLFKRVPSINRAQPRGPASPVPLLDQDILSLRQACNILTSLSIITINQNNKVVSMHPLAHAWAKDRMDQKRKDRAWACAAATLSLSIEERSDFRDFFPSLQPHIEVCLDLCPDSCFEVYPILEVCQMLYWMSWLLYRLNNSDKAEQIIRTIIEKTGHIFAPNSTDMLDLQYSLACNLTELGKVDEAIEIIKQKLKVEFVILGPEHPDCLSSQRVLAIAYARIGQPARAVEILEEVVKIQQNTLSPKNLYLLSSQHILGYAYTNMGQHERAAEILEKVVKIRRTTVSPENPNLLASQHELGRAYAGMGQHERTAEILEKVVKIRQTTLSPESPDLLTSQHELGRAYANMGQHKRAVEILEKVVKIRQTTLSPENPRLLSSQHVLGYAYANMGQHERAAEILGKVVKIRQTILSPENPDFLTSQHELACAYADMGQHERAVEILEKVVRIQQTTLSPENPDFLTSQHELGCAYANTGQHKRAAEILGKVVKIQQVTLSFEHRDRLASEWWLERCLAALRDKDRDSFEE